MDASFTWQDLERLRERWPHRLLVKGILRAEDASHCRAIGVDGCVVSNHGGRQLEDTVAPLDALPEVAANGPRVTLLDGGVRTGADVVKAVALGARMVLLGRAPCTDSPRAVRQGLVPCSNACAARWTRRLRSSGPPP